STKSHCRLRFRPHWGPSNVSRQPRWDFRRPRTRFVSGSGARRSYCRRAADRRTAPPAPTRAAQSIQLDSRLGAAVPVSNLGEFPLVSLAPSSLRTLTHVLALWQHVVRLRLRPLRSPFRLNPSPRPRKKESLASA